jgi:hypothetical protein
MERLSRHLVRASLNRRETEEMNLDVGKCTASF